jgi:ABC-type sugar transport system ATPase subunit
VSEPILILRGVSKSFAGIPAVQNVNLTIACGRTVGLVGENGAGKSTLMKIIAGVHPADSYDGELAIDGAPRRFRNVRDAEAAGIVLIPQELYIAPGLSIAENMFIGRLPGKAGFVDWHLLHHMAQQGLEFFGINAPVDAPAGILSPSEQRLVTIASALVKSARLLILDEPTAALTDEEALHLFDHIRRIKEQGVGCVYISHRLDEIDEIADSVVVMRGGSVVASYDTPKGNGDSIVRAMIGHDPEQPPPRPAHDRSEPILTIDKLRLHDIHDPARLRVADVSFVLHRGEILGLFGLVGAGRTELAKAIFGVWPGAIEGTIALGDEVGMSRSPRHAIRRGIGMLTEDRKQTGLIEGQTALTNISAANLDDVSGWLFIDATKEEARGDMLARRLDVRPPRLEADVETFSGGNQQKLLLARWLATKPRVLILDEPTIGVDIGARFELYRLIRSMADEGTAILMISSDLNEITEQCGRILVMYKGKIAGEFAHGASRHALMAAATGKGS